MTRTVCLFDLDGTLTDPREGIVACFQHAFAVLDRPAPPEAELQQWIGPPLRESFLLAFDGCGLTADRAVAAYRERFDRVGWRENRPVPGLVSTLSALHAAGVVCHVATSKPTVFAERIVQHYGFGRWFGRIYGSELDGSRADKAELIAFILEDQGLAGRDVVMIGDRRHDIAGARAHGLRSVGVLWGFGDRGELQGAGADAIAAHPGELAGLCLPGVDRWTGPMTLQQAMI